MAIPPILSQANLIGTLAVRTFGHLADVGDNFADVLRGEAAPGSEKAVDPGQAIVPKTDRTGATESVSLDELAGEVERLRSRIEELLVRQFDRAKIPTSPAVRFDTGPDGDVRVSGEHPQLHEIQRLIESQSELNALFRRLTDSVQQLSSFQQRRELQQYLAENPGATATNLIAQPPSWTTATLQGTALTIDVAQERSDG